MISCKHLNQQLSKML